MSFRPFFRDVLPIGLRRILRRGQRFAADVARGEDVSPPPLSVIGDWECIATVVQPMGTTPNATAKQRNIALGAAAISARPIASHALFSFWGWVGAPSRRRGFLDGRALRNGRLVLETGGGLCQLAGAVYFAGLLAGLRIEERHAHSTDLYTDETRYAPLGSDATVSFGFKDLRLRNPHDCAVAFDVRTDDGDLAVRVLAPAPMPSAAVEFRRTPAPDGCVEVETLVDGTAAARNIYLPFAG